MRIAETFFQPQNFLAHYREAKVSRLDGARVNRADSDLMHAIAFYLKKRVGSESRGYCCVPSMSRRSGNTVSGQPPWRSQPRLSGSVLATPRRSCIARSIRSADGNKGCETWIGGIRNVFHLVLEHQYVFWEKIGGVDAEVAVTVTIIRAPESEKAGAGFAQLFGGPSPLRSIHLHVTASQVRWNLSYRPSEEIKTHIHHPIKRAAARYHSASAGGM